LRKNKQRSKSTTAPVVDLTAQAAAEAAVTAMAELLIAEEDDLKQPPPSKLNSSNQARKRTNRRKENPDELSNGLKVHDEASSGSVASSSGRRDNGGERDEMGRDAACHRKPDGEMDAHAGPIFNKGDQGHNESEGHSISRNVQRVEAGSVEREAGISHNGVEQPLRTTQAECRQQKERERKGKQTQRKKATMRTTQEMMRATLEEALARVDTAGTSLDTLNALDAVIMSAKPVVSSCASGDLLHELLRQAEEKSMNLLREVRAMAKVAENKDAYVVCLEAPKNALLLRAST
jgi:hypothetical protein